MSVTRLRISSIKLIISIIGLCFALNLAADQLNIPNDVIPGRHSKPQLFPNHNKSALAEAALKSHGVPKKHMVVDGNSDEEARIFEEMLKALGPIINKLQGEGTSSLTESLLQTDAKIANGNKKLIKHLQSYTERSEAQESQLLATIETLRESEDPSDQAFGDFEFIELLNNPKSAKTFYMEWLNNEVSPSTAIKLLDRSFTDSIPERSFKKFFKHRSALPWLSYVGYWWKHDKVDFTEENLLQYFGLAHLDLEAMAELLYNARGFTFGKVVFDKMQHFLVINPSTRALAFRLEIMVSSLTDYSKFWQMLVEQTEKGHLKESPLNVWLEYVAFRLFHATHLSTFSSIKSAIEGFFQAKNMSVHDQRRIFEQILHDMDNMKVETTSYGLHMELQPFAKSENLDKFAQRDANLKNLAMFMIRYLQSA